MPVRVLDAGTSHWHICMLCALKLKLSIGAMSHQMCNHFKGRNVNEFGGFEFVKWEYLWRIIPVSKWVISTVSKSPK